MLDMRPIWPAFAQLAILYAACLSIGFAFKIAGRKIWPPPSAQTRKGPGIVRKFRNFFLFQTLMLVLSFWSLRALAVFFGVMFLFTAYEILKLRTDTHRYSPGYRFLPVPAFGILILFGFSLKAYLLFADCLQGRCWSLPAGGSPFLAFIFLLVAVSDGFSQITGQLLGGPKIVPRISPGKTWSGFWGGLFFCALVSCAGNALFFRFVGPLSSMALGLLVGVSAFLGDISASWVKRRLGIKDFSNLLGPQGGVLDRGDSLIWLGPILWLGYLLLHSCPVGASKF